ncbi:MAG: response regulator, partial [Massilia sp.]
ALKGHRIALAFDALSALAQANRNMPDAALLDIGLPGMDGYELAGLLRARPGGERLRIIAVTGYGQDSDRARALASGFDQHLSKPVDLAHLDELLQAAAKSRAA